MLIATRKVERDSDRFSLVFALCWLPRLRS